MMSKSLRVGDAAPSFTATDHKGQTHSLASLKGAWVVLFFYPKNNTAGCTKQVCAFRDAYQDFTDLNAKVIGVSKADKGEHESFSAQYNLPFPLIMDKGDALRKEFRVPKDLGLIPGRVTYVISPQGRIELIFNSQLNPEAHIAEAKRIIQAHSPEKAIPGSQTL